MSAWPSQKGKAARVQTCELGWSFIDLFHDNRKPCIVSKPGWTCVFSEAVFRKRDQVTCQGQDGFSSCPGNRNNALPLSPVSGAQKRLEHSDVFIAGLEQQKFILSASEIQSPRQGHSVMSCSHHKVPLCPFSPKILFLGIEWTWFFGGRVIATSVQIWTFSRFHYYCFIFNRLSWCMESRQENAAIRKTLQQF